MSADFNSLCLNSMLVEGLKKQNITIPTDIQEKVIPQALENKDIIGQSQTGSGKTLAYLLPIFQKVDESKREMQAIILSPTHELAMQINNQIKLLADNSTKPVKSAVIVGEVNIKRQIDRLKEKPHIIVGSIGRILELINMKKLTAHTIRTLVIDEGDRLLYKNNYEKILSLRKALMRDIQTMVFSASINTGTMDLAMNLLNNPEIIRIENKELINPNIEHMYFVAEQRDKMEVLRKIIASVKPNKAIIFVNKSDEVDIVAEKLRYHHFAAISLHGSTSKEERQAAMEGFRSGKYTLLVASDLAARGLDVDDITHIINLDFSRDSKEYLHRIGRTGRMGKIGTAISIVTKFEAQQVKDFEKQFAIKIQAKEVYMGNIIDYNTNKVKANKINEVIKPLKPREINKKSIHQVKK